MREVRVRKRTEGKDAHGKVERLGAFMRAFRQSYAEMMARLDVVAAGRDVGGRGLLASSLPAASVAPASVAGLEEAPWDLG
jgi:hypothetical protein